MGHHGTPKFDSEFFDDLGKVKDPRKLMESFNRPPSPPNLGATGKFPDGKLNDDDEGEIQIGLTEKDGVVVLDFGKPVSWVGFSKEQAKEIGQMLIDKANK